MFSRGFAQHGLRTGAVHNHQWLEMSKKPATPFQPAHCLQFGLKIAEEANKHVTSVRCNFCAFFGRAKIKASDEHASEKRQCSSCNDTKYWTSFAPQNYRSHHESQHTDLWAEYSTLSNEEKRTHFDGKTNRANTLHRYVDLESDSLTFHVSAPIVDVIISDLFFRPNEVLIDFDDDDDKDDGGAAAAIAKKAVAKAKQKTLALKLFVKEVANIDEDEYVVTIKGTMRYELAMDHVSTGMSFRQVAAAMQHTKERCNLSKLGGINDTIVGQYVRAGVVFALQRIVDLCIDESIWALSLAGDGNTHRGQHFFDLRLRVCYRGVLLNLHLVAISQFDRHTALNTFNMLVKFLDALYGLSRRKLINMGTDSEPTIVGRLNGLVTRMAREAEHHILRIWCPPHQMDVVVKDGAEMLYDGEWSKQAWSLSVYLHSQANLITHMNMKCPKKTNRWVSLGVLLNFLKQYRRTIIQHVTVNANDKLPSNQWWVITYAIAPAIEEINKMFVMSQSPLAADRAARIIHPDAHRHFGRNVRHRPCQRRRQ